MRKIVVTGGGTGIGRAVAEAFAARGDQVVITGRRKDVLEQTAAQLGPGVRAIAFDATDPAQVSAVVQTANGRAGTPTDIAGTVLFLASPVASHITGQTLHVNGGALAGR